MKQPLKDISGDLMLTDAPVPVRAPAELLVGTLCALMGAKTERASMMETV